MLSEQEQIRREKLNKLKEMGIDPFPAALFPINTNSLEIISNYKENKKVSIAGRLMSRRIQGKASFAEIKGKFKFILIETKYVLEKIKPCTTKFIKNFLTLEILLE
jgi:lysyl-tRNA synthetase class II